MTLTEQQNKLLGMPTGYMVAQIIPQGYRSTLIQLGLESIACEKAGDEEGHELALKAIDRYSAKLRETFPVLFV